MDFKENLNDEQIGVLTDDDDLDFAIASSIQSHYERENVESTVNQVYPKSERESTSFSDDEDIDFAIASSLQSEFESETNSESQSCKDYSEDDTYLRKLDEDLDYALALSLQSAYSGEVEKNFNNQFVNSEKSSLAKPLSIVDEKWELIDPNPDIYALFQEYNKRFFFGALGSVSVSWSPRMTLCAGVCSYEGRGGLCSVRLSMPLLKLRPRKDLVETLLHEMIHAYLFVTHNWRDRGDHGPKFLEHMHRINKEGGSNITVYHSFHDEVDHYRKHVWQCDGPCKHRPPYYGQVKRAINRAPGPRDPWWADHQSRCGGTYIKIKEPDKSNKKSNGRSNNSTKGINRKPTDPPKTGSYSDIRSFFKDDASKPSSSGKNISNLGIASSSKIATITSVTEEESNFLTNSSTGQLKTNFVAFKGTGFKLGGKSLGEYDVNPLISSSSGFRKDSSSTFKKNKESPYSKTSKFPQNSSFNGIKTPIKGSVPSSGAAYNISPKKLIQSPMDKYLSSQQSAKSVKQLNGNDSKTSLKIECPLCFLQFKMNEINSHVDECLLTH